MTRVVLITGCSSGIGLATAVAFAQGGDRVIATCRRPAAATELADALAGTDHEIAALDVTDDAQATALVERLGPIDVLVNNAAIGADATLEELSLTDIAAVMDTNFTGPVRLMKAVLPAMREAGSGRIINVSSMAGQLGQPFNDAYCASKFALTGVCESLWPVVSRFGVFVSVVEPGPTDTPMLGRMIRPGEQWEDNPYRSLRAAFGDVQGKGYETAQTAQEIAEVIVQVADDPDPAPRYQTSEAVQRFFGVKLKDLSGRRVVGVTAAWLGPS